MLDEASILHRIRNGCDTDAVAAFEHLYRAWVEPLCDFAMIYVRQWDMAADIVDDVFANIWTHRTQWSPERGFGSYLRGSVRNRTRNALRDASRTTVRDAALVWSLGDLTTLVPTPDTNAEFLEQAAHLWREVEQLSDMRKLAVTLRWQQGLNNAEIAELMDISEGAVRVHITRALTQLRERLGDTYP